jgi:DNA primase large subunit
MEARHAHYPFLEGAREAVEGTSVDLERLVEREDEPVVERAVTRVNAAIAEGNVGAIHRNPRVELLSYPIARILVSIVDERVLTRKFARAEARSAIDRFTADRTGGEALRSTSEEPLRLEDLLEEFGVDDDVRPTEDGYRVAVATYLRFAANVWGDEWRLVNRTLDDGLTWIGGGELTTLIREAIAQRVEAGLPLSVPDRVAAALEPEAEAIRERLADLELTREIDTVVPERFPPCMRHLLDQIQRGEHLAHHSRFAITSFLTTIGLSTDEIVELYMVNSSFGEDMTRYQTDHIRGETGSTAYTPPSCATMQSYGDCVNMDDRCETIAHPLAYYEKALDDADEDELVDWRERDEGAGDEDT